MTQKALPHENLSTKPQKISQNYEIVFIHYLVKFLIWRPFSPINKLPINTQVKATVATNQNSSFNNPRTITARWLHMHALMEPYIKKLQNNHNISFSYKSFEFHSSGTQHRFLKRWGGGTKFLTSQITPPPKKNDPGEGGGVEYLITLTSFSLVISIFSIILFQFFTCS